MAFVNDCPKNETEVIKSSKRLKCGTDDYGNNQYICVPNKEKSSLVELCFDGIIGPQENGICIEESEGRLFPYNCSNFRYGCPDNFFDSNEVYKYPACQEINTQYRCYVMDPSCQPQESKKENDVAVFYACLGVFVAVLIVVAILLNQKWKLKWKCRGGKSKYGYTETKRKEDNNNTSFRSCTFKIWSKDRNRKLGICLSNRNFKELEEKCIDKLFIDKDESHHVTFVLECDGTVVDEEYFKSLETNTMIMILKRGEEWEEAANPVTSKPTGNKKNNLSNSLQQSLPYEEKSSSRIDVCSFDRKKEYAIDISDRALEDLKIECKRRFETNKEDERHVKFVLEIDGTEVDDEYFKNIDPGTKIMILNHDEKWSQQSLSQSEKCNTLSEPSCETSSRATILFKVWSFDRKIKKGIVSRRNIADLKKKCKKKFEINEKEVDHVRIVLEKNGNDVTDELLKTIETNTTFIILKEHEHWSSGKTLWCFQ